MPVVMVAIEFEETFRAPGAEFTDQEFCAAVSERIGPAFVLPLMKAKVSPVVGITGEPKVEPLVVFEARRRFVRLEEKPVLALDAHRKNGRL